MYIVTLIRYRRGGLDERELRFNASLSVLRVAVEWAINLVVSRFIFYFFFHFVTFIQI